MTVADFTAFYPQFANFTPSIVLSTYVGLANKRFSSFTEEDAEEARRLYAAHRLTIYARVALPDGATPTKAAIATAGQAQQKVASKKVGEVAVSYSTSNSIASTTTGFADLTETEFGLALLSLLRLYGRSRYVP